MLLTSVVQPNFGRNSELRARYDALEKDVWQRNKDRDKNIEIKQSFNVSMMMEESQLVLVGEGGGGRVVPSSTRSVTMRAWSRASLEFIAGSSTW